MKKKIIMSSLIFIIVTLLFSITVNATETGTINFKAVNNSDSSVIADLEIAIYQVSYTENDNFNWGAGFEDCTIDISDLSEDNIAELKIYAEENAEILYTKTTDSSGEFTISNLALGTYLLVQANKTDEVTMQTALVTIPELTSESGLEYEITVKPKIVSISTLSSSTSSSTVSASSSSSLVTASTLPYTGVLDWPVPILVTVGLVLFCISWLKVFSNKKKKIN